MPDLIVETGDIVRNSDAYISRDACDTYWINRPHNALSTTWAAGSEGNRDGAIREASAYMDATWGQFYRGVHSGGVQGLLWPRVDAFDDAGVLIQGLPSQIVDACAELAARALSARLRPDLDRGNAIARKREKLGPLEREFEYLDDATPEKTYGYVLGLLAPVLNGGQDGAADHWSWA